MGAEVVAGGGGRWGTWEELLLGGAVLRHGTRNWDLVAAELRTRTVCPFKFTPEVCKAKYEDLQHKFNGCKTLFEELRKQRMAELKQALEKSEDSIGSLESKLEVLKSEIPNHCNGVVETSSKETSKDGLSASSFTQENRTSYSPRCQVPESTSLEHIETKPDVSMLLPKQEHVSSIGYLAETFSVRRRRGKRKRKDCRKEVKEGSVGESECWGSADILSAASSGQTGKCSGVDENKSKSSNKGEVPEIVRVFDSIAENKCATVFSRRLDSQKRGRYKKMIKLHLDFDTLRSRITSCAITSVKELFRDLLLLANNALVFYSKTTREYKSAFQLREIVKKSLRENLKDYYINADVLKPRSVCPANQTAVIKVSKTTNNVVKTPNPAKKASNVHSPVSAQSLTATKKALGRPKKTGQGPENTVRGRKRSRAK